MYNLFDDVIPCISTLQGDTENQCVVWDTELDIRRWKVSVMIMDLLLIRAYLDLQHFGAILSSIPCHNIYDQ